MEDSQKPRRRKARQRLGVRFQVLLLTLIPLAFLLALLIVATMLQGVTREAAALSQHSSDVVAQADRAGGLIAEANRSAIAFTKTRAGRDLRGYRIASAALPGALARLRALAAPDPVSQKAAARLAGDTSEAFSVIGEYIRDLQDHDKRAIAALEARPSLRHLGQELEDAKSSFDGRERALALAELGSLRRSGELEGRLILVLAGGGIVLTLLIALRYGLAFSRRLQLLAENARRLGSGQSALTIPGNDEIAELDTVYRTMAERLRREHRVATELQRALLPQELPSFDGLRLDSAYVPAAHGTEVGGDWFDVFSLGDAQIGISVGDVAGHGLRAAAVMGAMRQSIRTAARIESRPSAVLRHVNQVLCSDEGVLVTAFFGVFERRTGELRYAIAGHPPPLVVRADASVAAMPGGGIVLGLDARTQYDDFEIRLDVGCGAVFYTDGLVEVERDYFKGVRDLERAVIDELAAPSSNVADGIQRRIFAHAEPRDDSAVLFLGVAALAAATNGETKVWEVDARDTISTRRVKRAMIWHLGGLTSGESELHAAELAFGELIGNVARHTPGPATVALEHAHGAYVLHVDDEGPPFVLNGAGQPDVLAESGRGLFLLRSVAHDVNVTRTSRGNRVSVVLSRGGAPAS